MTPQAIAHYRVTAKISQGGMGEVYRATDTKLGREVAIKVVPEAFANSAERMARFEREAQVLASLNHPKIAAIYGVEQGAIVMGLVEGETLSGPLPIETALDYARQTAVALEAREGNRPSRSETSQREDHTRGQQIRIIFDKPVSVHRMELRFP